jgi:hypothetical protein
VLPARLGHSAAPHGTAQHVTARASVR